MFADVNKKYENDRQIVARGARKSQISCHLGISTDETFWIF